MSSSDSTVTHMSISSEDVPFWGICFFGMEQPYSPEAAPRSPIQTPPVPQGEDEREPMFIQPHDPDYVPEPIHPKYIPLEDEHVLLAEEQPLPHVISPTAESPEYVTESDPEEDPEEYEDDETEDGPVDYLMDRGDDGDDDNDESSGDDTNDEDEDEEEEHFVPADFVIVIPTDELVSPPEGKEPVIPPPSTDTTTTGARITVRLQASISLPPEAEGAPGLVHDPICMSITTTYAITITTIIWVSNPNPDTQVDPAETVLEIAPMTVGEDSRTRISQRVAMDSQRVDLLMEDRIAYQETILIVEEEAYAAQEAWAHSIGLSQTVHSEL
nr:hypothetical protein [Tanacetum cinerariifolium]